VSVKTICIALRSDSGAAHPARPDGVRSIDRTRAHFAERGVEASYFYGIPAAKLGLATELTYEVDNPGGRWNMGARPLGCWLSHRAAWSACLLCPDDEFFLLEEDAKFPSDWKQQLDAARADTPSDWDLLFLGSCCAGSLYRAATGRTDRLQNRPREHVKGSIWRSHPMCLHAYLVRRRALETMIDTTDAAGAYAPIDISLLRHTMQQLAVYAVLPRIVDQFDTDLSE
jgi:GR25 family glycosyltransferase involved in LPS biosynthesis